MKKVFLKISQNLHEHTYNPFSLGLTSVISKQMLLFESLKDLSQETSTDSKLATETLKQDVKSVIS